MLFFIISVVYNLLHACFYLFFLLCTVSETKRAVVVKKYLYKLWRDLLDKGVTDPDTGTHYVAEVREGRAKGFAKCDECSRLEGAVANAQTHEDMDALLDELRKHHESVKQDRIEFARISRLCKTDPRHVGFMIDAVDKKKFQLPTTERDSKSLQKLKRLIHKITGVPFCHDDSVHLFIALLILFIRQFTGVQFLHDDSVHLFTALPDVPTGGNLTMTIIADIFNKTKCIKNATDVYINFDGASDNICYHVFYGLAFLLKCASQSGWPLRRIHILRFKVAITHSHTHHVHRHYHAPHSHTHTYTTCTHRTHTLSCASCDCLQVGHTHNQLDATFGLLSQHVYGKISGGTTKRDVLSFSGLETVTCMMCSYIVYHVHVPPNYSFFDI